MKNVSIDYPEYFPDHVFKKYCLESFGVNKGICNTVDEMLYQQGIYDVANRRKMILDFLSYRSIQTEKKKNGAGSLSNLIDEFLLLKRNHYIKMKIAD